MFRTRDKLSLFRWVYRLPTGLFACETALLAPLILAWEHAWLAATYAFILPVLALALTLLNLPFAFAFCRAFQMDEAKRRNHVLEHATILHLEQISGRRFSGRASGNGFRVAGRASIADIRLAFEQVRRTVQAGQPLSYVSRHCGSNVVTTQGFGLLALLLVTVTAVLWQPPITVRVVLRTSWRRWCACGRSSRWVGIGRLERAARGRSPSPAMSAGGRLSELRGNPKPTRRAAHYAWPRWIRKHDTHINGGRLVLEPVRSHRA